ncbi:MAG TPA: NAD(P)H-hydrate dehydratase [Lacunisphaera sp.]|nr:NAD(P)H-hydrate dehydratase [Lacunisphaera sp.]
MNPINSHPILSCPDARAWEASMLGGESAEWTAMQHAGRAIGSAILEDFREIGGLPANARLLVLAGRGHNGGDALLAARAILAERPETRAVVVLCFGEDQLRPLAGRALGWLKRDAPGRVEVVPSAQALAASEACALCLDGIFGFSFRAPMDAGIAPLIAAVNENAHIRFRAAVDLPSGVGEENAETIFRADFTYATGIVKLPVLSPEVAASVGRLRYLDLGFFGGEGIFETPERILTAQVLSPLGELRASQTDKRTYGHLFVVGGSRSYPGAVVLAVRAALRSGAGLVTAFVPERMASEYAAHHPEAMWVGCPVTTAGGLAPETMALIRERLSRATAILIGPGLGAEPETLAWVANLAAEVTVPLVLDADALRPEVISRVKGRPFIGTPHAGELQRIAPGLFKNGQFTAPKGVLVLKGPLTRVTDGRTTYYSSFGGPVLARGGSGDILAGLIGGLLAQKPNDLRLAACRGVVWHGRAADLLARARGQVAVEIGEILEQLGPALLP